MLFELLINCRHCRRKRPVINATSANRRHLLLAILQIFEFRIGDLDRFDRGTDCIQLRLQKVSTVRIQRTERYDFLRVKRRLSIGLCFFRRIGFCVAGGRFCAGVFGQISVQNTFRLNSRRFYRPRKEFRNNDRVVQVRKREEEDQKGDETSIVHDGILRSLCTSSASVEEAKATATMGGGPKCRTKPRQRVTRLQYAARQQFAVGSDFLVKNVVTRRRQDIDAAVCGHFTRRQFPGMRTVS